MLESTTMSDEIYDLIENRIDRCMFVLVYKWGLTYEEIGQAFNIPPEVVSSHISKTKDVLKRALDE
jgi:DNA-directed RNA polymerase specialized sigma24 family protein